MIISKSIEIDMAHRLPNHNGKCKNFHGHRYMFVASVSGNVESESAMVIDFGDFKRILENEISYKYDHSMMICKDDKYIDAFEKMKKDGMNIHIVDYIPTVEEMGKAIFIDLQNRLNEFGIKLISLKIWETPTSMAEIREGDIK